METSSLFIKAVDREAISWFTYKMPLTKDAWVALICFALGIASLLFITDNIMENKTKSIVSAFITRICVSFGKI